MTQDWAVRGNEIAREAAQKAELSGSEKQVAWATDIIKKFAFVASTSAFKTAEQEESIGFIDWVIENNTAARWWIDNRNALERYGLIDDLLEAWKKETR